MTITRFLYSEGLMSYNDYVYRNPVGVNSGLSFSLLLIIGIDKNKGKTVSW